MNFKGIYSYFIEWKDAKNFKNTFNFSPLKSCSNYKKCL